MKNIQGIILLLSFLFTIQCEDISSPSNKIVGLSEEQIANLRKDTNVVFIDYPVLSPKTQEAVFLRRVMVEEVIDEEKTLSVSYIIREKGVSSSDSALKELLYIQNMIKLKYSDFWNLKGNVRSDSILSFSNQILNEKRPLDPYSNYSAPVIADKTLDNLIGPTQVIAVGFRSQVEETGDTLVVTQVSPDSPAHDVGLKVGDRIISINGNLVIDSSLDQFSTLVAGGEGTKIILQIYRNSELLVLPPALKRQVVFPTVIVGDGGDHGYIMITRFSSSTVTLNGVKQTTSSELVLALEKTKTYPVTILDLRNNGGGLVSQVLEMVNQFLVEGNIVTFFSRKLDGNQNPINHKDIRQATADGIGTRRKFVLLVNRGTASASEIFASSLNEGLNIPIVGERTFGKAVGQSLFKTPLGGLFQLTTLKILSRNGNNYQGIGLTPDYPVASEFALQKANEVANSMLGIIDVSFKRTALQPFLDIVHEVNPDENTNTDMIYDL